MYEQKIFNLNRMQTRYIRNNKCISGRLNDELVMMNMDKGKYFSLNPVATRIWDMLEKPMIIDDLCVLLMGEYEVCEEECRSEVGEVIAEMVRLGIVLED